MPNSLHFDDPDIELALFKHGLIAQLIHHPPASGRLEGELRALAGQTYQIPHSRRTRVSISTLRRYLNAYRDSSVWFRGTTAQAAQRPRYTARI